MLPLNRADISKRSDWIRVDFDTSRSVLSLGPDFPRAETEVKARATATVYRDRRPK
jgi:hypothetical protein